MIREEIYNIVLATRTEGIIRGKTKRFAEYDTDEILTKIRSQIEQIGNPYRAERIMKEQQWHINIPPSEAEATYESCKHDVLNLLVRSYEVSDNIC